MGFSPDDVEKMSLWQFNVAFDGWCRAQGIEQKEDILTDDMMAEFDKLTSRTAH